MNDIIYVGQHSITYNVQKHLHKSWELIYCTSGEGDLHFEKKSVHYTSDSIVIIPPMTVHKNHSDEGFTNIHINMTDVNLNYTEPVVFQLPPNKYLRQTFEAAYHFYTGGGLGQSMILPVYGQLIVTMLQVTLADKPHSKVVSAIEDRILHNYCDSEFDLNACLQSFSFNTEYLIKLFKKETGFTPRQYLTNKRLENAANILAVMGGSKNIGLAARQSGYNDALYFSKLFKQRYGVSPKFYNPSRLGPPSTDPNAAKINPDSRQEEQTSK